MAGWDPAQCDVKTVITSFNGSFVAYAVDGSGSEVYSIRLRDLRGGECCYEEFDEQINGTMGAIAWSYNEIIFYGEVWASAVGDCRPLDEAGAAA